MTTKDYQRMSPLRIFLSYFKNHKGLFAIDVLCAVGIAAIDLLFPLVTRSALYNMLPNQMYKTFFTVMIAVVACYLLRSCLNYIVAYYGHTFGIINSGNITVSNGSAKHVFIFVTYFHTTI